MDTDYQSQARVEEERETLVQNLFHRHNPWLNLDNPACPIQEITIVDKTQSDPRSDNFKNFTISNVRKHAENAPNLNIIYQVTSESENQTASEMWNEWVQM